MEYAITVKDDFLVTWIVSKGAGAYFCYAQIPLHKDSVVCEPPGLNVQLWGLHGSGFSYLMDLFLSFDVYPC